MKGVKGVICPGGIYKGGGGVDGEFGLEVGGSEGPGRLSN